MGNNQEVQPMAVDAAQAVEAEDMPIDLQNPPPNVEISDLTNNLNIGGGDNSDSSVDQPMSSDDEGNDLDQQANVPAAIQAAIGEGLLNIIQAYDGIEADNGDGQDDIHGNVEENDADVDMMEDVGMLSPNHAHLQIGMAKTHFFQIPDEHAVTQSFSKQGMKIWQKYFAPHISDMNSCKNGQVFEIPVSWFNFITLMLVTPEKFDWTINFLQSSLWEFIKEPIIDERTVAFKIPEKCSVQVAPS
jgi:hypothetical protein